VIWTGVVRLFGYPLATAFLVGVGLTQIGEFSFILVQVARAAGHVGADVYNATLAASLLTILVNATLVRLAPPRWVEPRHADSATAAPVPNAGHVVLCGFGRVGSAVGEAFDTFGLPYTVVERNPDVIRALRARGVPSVFGDAGQTAVLHAAGAEHAVLIVVALPDADAASSATRAVRAVNPHAPIIARAHRLGEADDLRHRGATAVVQPELEAAATVIRHALGAMRLPDAATVSYLERFRPAMAAADGPPATEGSLPEVHELTLAGGRLADQSLREAQIRERFGVTVVAIRRKDGSVVFNPSPDSVLRDGDQVRVFGLAQQIHSMRLEAETA